MSSVAVESVANELSQREREDFARSAFHSASSAQTSLSSVIPPSLTVPKGVRAALQQDISLLSLCSHKWADAMKKEMNSIRDMNVFTVLAHRPSMRLLNAHFVFDIKPDAEGRHEQLKARLVARGDQQSKERGDYTDSSSPVAHKCTIRLLLAVACAMDWTCVQMDVGTAFLNAPVKEELYMRPPPGSGDENKNVVWKLNKALYGLVQAGRCWNECFNLFLTRQGFTRSPADACLYVKRFGKTGLVLMGIWVDDCLIVSSDETLRDATIKMMRDEYKMKGGEPVNHFIKMKVERNLKERTLTISQPGYIRNILHARGYDTQDPDQLPASPSVRLEKAKDDDELYKGDYAAQIGEVNFIAGQTRPDIALAVHRLSRYCAKPTLVHKKALDKLYRFLLGSLHSGITYNGDLARKELLSSGPVTYSDSSLKDCNDTFRSTAGHVVLVGGGAIEWESKLVGSISDSSTEAEYKAIAKATKTIMFIRQILRDMSFPPRGPSIIYGDNEGARHLVDNFTSGKRSRHISSKYHLAREQREKGNMVQLHVDTSLNTADIFTKALSKEVFYRHSLGLGIIPCSKDLNYGVQSKDPKKRLLKDRQDTD